MWIFKVRSHYTTQSYWVRIGNVPFSDAKKVVQKTHHLEDWKWDEGGDVARCFPAFN